MTIPDSIPGFPPDGNEIDTMRGFLGCVMTCSQHRAAELLAGMSATDAGPGLHGVVLGLVVEVVAAGLAPDPRVLIAEAQRRGLLDTEDKHQQFALWLVDTYRTAPYPEAGQALRGAVLEAAYRRELRDHAERLLRATDYAGVETLHVLAELDDRLVELWRRLATDLHSRGLDTAPTGPRRLPPRAEPDLGTADARHAA